ncbi:MAG TPA: UDP-N-acetylmuramoyl-L-alanine--D-glutamate ligase [Roseiarcus sp.]|jgi:UDP-N-acetylmuramoylalanine--D-glutamate ligase|nr:UDP-N-acetylmuramoyl-L-alanine--D-glutamate ligase [Roseiarcus sp.]
MTPVETLRGQRVAVFGLGGSGLSTIRALAEGGAEAVAWDDGAKARERAAAAGFRLVDLAEADWRSFKLLVLSPGAPLTHPKPHWTVELAHDAGVPIVGDIELFVRERAARAQRAPFVAITGTNGKSTTSALIAHVLKEAGHDVALGGNIGVPVLDLPPPAENRTHVVECSSYQIDLSPSLAPGVGLLINITPDHLDRHGDLARYAAIKERLVARSAIALVGVDDEPCRAICARLKSCPVPPRVVAVSGDDSPLADVLIRDRRVVARTEAGASLDLAGARALRGSHNGQNAAFAYGAARALGVAARTIAEAFESFPGLAHRMEEVGRRGKVLFINDSKATNADAAEKALKSFHDIYWITGGRPKEGGIELLRPLYPRVAKAYLIGEATDAFARTLAGAVPYERCGTLGAATEAAARDALRSGADEPAVLLSPACASFDQFANFEARGEAFRAAVDRLMRGDS